MPLVVNNKKQYKFNISYFDTEIALEKLMNLLPAIDSILTEGIDKHYTAFQIPKRNGKGFRTINAPNRKLKSIQQRILYILDKYTKLRIKDRWVFGFVKGKSIGDNALFHTKGRKFTKYNWTFDRRTTILLGKPSENLDPKLHSKGQASIIEHTKYSPESMVRLDIKDAFGSVSKAMVKKAILEQLPHREELIDKILEVCTLNGSLPQGAPTSPFFLNLALKDFDIQCKKLIATRVLRINTRAGLIKDPTLYGTEKSGNLLFAQYSRYADDITISCNKKDIAKTFISFIEASARTMGLQIKRKKTRIMAQGTGFFVNGINITNCLTHISTSRRYRNKLRALINRAALEQDFTKRTKLIKKVIGRITFVSSIDRIHGTILLKYAVHRGILDENIVVCGLNLAQRLANDTQIIKSRTEFYQSSKQFNSKTSINHEFNKYKNDYSSMDQNGPRYW